MQLAPRLLIGTSLGFFEILTRKADIIIAEEIPLQGLSVAVMNRLRKAANFDIIRV